MREIFVSTISSTERRFRILGLLTALTEPVTFKLVGESIDPHDIPDIRQPDLDFCQALTDIPGYSTITIVRDAVIAQSWNNSIYGAVIDAICDHLNWPRDEVLLVNEDPPSVERRIRDKPWAH